MKNLKKLPQGHCDVCNSCYTPCIYGGPFKYIEDESVDLERYIPSVYGRCKTMEEKKPHCKCMFLNLDQQLCDNWESYDYQTWSNLFKEYSCS